jgi:dipeptidyl aminopeptidase/acylaminoacyl peptidase
MQPSHLSAYCVPSDPRLHPDGRRAAFVVTRMDLDADRYDRSIWLWDGERARRLTSGPGDVSPRWSPDGSRLAFLRRRVAAEATPQVAVMPIDGGEAEVVTDFELGVSELDWSPDGSRIAVVATVWSDEYRDLEADERIRRPRRITRLPYRSNDRGWTHDRRSHVYVVDPAGEAEPRCLTPGDFDESSLAWHPDGTQVAFISSRHDERGLDAGSQVWTVPVRGGAATAVCAVGLWSRPSYDRDGRLHAIGNRGRWNMVTVRRLHRVSGPGNEIPLFPGIGRNLDTLAPPLAPGGPQWLDDGAALSTLEDSGRVRVVRLHPDGTTTDVVGGDLLVTGLDPRPDGSAFAFVAAAPTDPGDLWWWEDGTETRLTDLNAGFRAAADLVTPQRFEFDADGLTVEGWVYLPPGDEAVPLLLNIHGGPATQYGYGFFDEFQVYAGAGYGVVAINPRGSSGYGHDHVHAVVGRWHDPMPPDIADFLQAIEAAAQQFPRLDPERLGVMGGSYGGLSTVRLLGVDQRFRSAVAERGLYSWSSFHGTSDIGPWFTKVYVGADMGSDSDRIRASSPLAFASTITTPTLIIHAESDFRTPVEQAEQLFVRLLQNGVETALLRFPAGETHELSRSGSPKHRMERFEAILDWHAAHLASEPTTAAARPRPGPES